MGMKLGKWWSRTNLVLLASRRLLQEEAYANFLDERFF